MTDFQTMCDIVIFPRPKMSRFQKEL
jgi:hypothetical protein